VPVFHLFVQMASAFLLVLLGMCEQAVSGMRKALVQAGEKIVTPMDRIS